MTHEHITEDGSTQATHTAGDIMTTIRVILGGNGRWTRVLIQQELGPLDKRITRSKPPRRTKGKVLRHEMPGQVATREEAMRWARAKWKELGLP